MIKGQLITLRLMKEDDITTLDTSNELHLNIDEDIIYKKGTDFIIVKDHRDEPP